jgi:glycosyltransferase involved in cell wall biosynthesis
VKITYLHQYFTTPGMSGGSRSYEMARRLVKMGHEVNLITSEREGKSGHAVRWFETEDSGIRVHWCPVPYSNNMSYRDRIIAFFKFAFRAAKRSAAINSDVIFASSTPLTIALPAIYASKIKRVPMVFEVRDLWPELPIAVGALQNPVAIKAAQWLENFAYHNSTRIVALSPGMKTGVVSRGFPEEQITVIPNCSDLEMFQVDESKGRVLRSKYHWLQDHPLVIYTGTIGLVNGIDYIARLAASVRSLDSDIRFLVLGTGREEERVRRLAEELGVLDTNVYMMPPIPKLEVPYWLSAADIATSFFIDNKALWNNSANKFFDALASGTPIAINHGGWQADLLQETDAGLVLEANDTDAAAEKLVNAIHDKPWLTRAGSAARELAKTRFDREQLAIQLESVLRQSVDGH